MALTVRNLTPTALKLTRLERFDKTEDGHAVEESGGIIGSICNITKALTAWFYSSSNKGSPDKNAGRADSEHQDVDLRIDRFSTCGTELEAPGEKGLRLFIDDGGQTYRVEIIPSNPRAVRMMPTAHPAGGDYTAIYSQQHHHLAIFLTSKLGCWMKDLSDETPIARLSIPGTHNSPTCHRALPSVRCQAVPPREQLENGVRFFDVRVQVKNPQDASDDSLILVHSAFSVSLTGTWYFRDLVEEIYRFLDENPSETILISLKREGTGKGTDQQLANILRKYYAGDMERWYTAPSLPKLGQVRRRLVLLRRFHIDELLAKEHGGTGWGIDGATWADNTPHALSPSGELCIQDFYEVPDTQGINKKIEYSTEQLARSAAATLPPPSGTISAQEFQQLPLFINFLSASNLWSVSCWPENIAAKLNPAVVDYLCRAHNEALEHREDGGGGGATGVVVCDWVGNDGDWDLVHAIVGMNATLRVKSSE